MAANASTVKVTFLGDANQLNRVAKGVNDNTTSMGDKFKKFGKVAAVALAAAGAAVGAAGVKLFNHGAQLEAMGNKAATVFGDQIDTVGKWAKANAAGMGLSSREVVGLAANFGDLLIPMGFTREEAAKMSTDVVGLSGALSQWSGGTISASQASDVLAKAMLGERDGLKALGISISDNDVKQRLLKNGTDQLTGAALEQAKATATQQLIMEKSTDAQAAYKEGGNKLLVAQNALKSKLKELYDELAVKLIPVFTALSTWLVTKGIPLAGELAAKFRQHVLPILKDVGAFITGTLVPALRTFGEWINRNKDFLIPFVAIIATAVAGFKVYAAIQKTVTAVTAAWNAVLLMNPIGVVVVLIAALAAGLVVAYKRSETFRNIVKGAMSGALGAVQGFLGGIESMLRALGRIPGFGWADAAADKVRGAAHAVGLLRDRMAQIKSKTVTVTVVQTQLNNIGSVPYRQRAHGGPVMKGQSYLVGEREPEMFVPDTNGRIMNQRQMAAAGAKGGGGVSIGNVSITVNGGNGDAATAVAIRDELLKLGRRNGAGMDHSAAGAIFGGRA